MKQSLYIIDGNGYIHQAFYALTNLTAPDGKPTNAVYGFIKIIEKLIKTRNPNYIAVCFDKPGAKFRHKLYEDYKANRQAVPEDLIVQITMIKDLLSTYKISMFEKEGYEADDLILSIAKKFENENLDIYILSSDKDLYQVINNNISIYDIKKNLVYGREHSIEKFGLEPENLIDYFSLVGDSADNIPGVKGIGPKNAKKLFAKWKTLENLYDNLSSVTPERMKKLLEKDKENAFLSKKLFALKVVDLDFSLDSLKYDKDYTREKVIKYASLGFNSLIPSNKIFILKSENPKKAEIKATEIKITIINKKEELEKVVEKLKNQEFIFIDLDFTERKIWDNKLNAISFSTKESETFYIDLENNNIDIKDIWRILNPILKGKPKKIGYDLKSIYRNVYTNGVVINPLYFDIMLASNLLDSNEKNVSAENIISKYTNSNLDKILEDDKIRYIAIKSQKLIQLYSILDGLLKDKNLDDLFYSVEMNLISIVAEMELAGIIVDTVELDKIKKLFEIDFNKFEDNIYKLAGQTFNVSSPQQLSYILFEKLNLPKGKKTKTGYSTDAEVLEKLSSEHELPGLVLEYRKIAKLLNTYILSLPKMMNPFNNKIYTFFKQLGTSTGRIISSSPNLQNIPIRDRFGSYIRSCFVSKEKNIFLSVDYSQIELKILAHYSKDEYLIQAFNKGEDIHKYTASKIFEVSIDKVDQDQRRIAKSVNFGIIYGQTPYGLSKELKISFSDAKKFIDSYFENYTGVKLFIDDLIVETRETQYVSTILNRRRYIPEIISRNKNVRNLGERLAVNTVMQGSAADIIKKAMINIDRKRNEDMLIFKFLLQIHDELIFEVPESILENVKNLVEKEMVSCVKLEVPLTIKIAVGKNWREVEFGQ